MKSSHTAAPPKKNASRIIGAVLQSQRSPLKRDLMRPHADYVRWQIEVVAILRKDLYEVVTGVTADDVDWPAWQEYFTAGKTPRAAVQRALERDL